MEEISLPLLTKMSSERTLAVQAELMQQPDKSLALLAWTLCLNVFGSGAYSNACSLNGVQTRECGHTSRSPLDSLESAIGFHMRDWWQPTKANFFGHLKKPQIIAALNEAGLSGAARDAEKMKKGDAAEHAEFHMKDNRWVPGWMCSPRPQTDATERADNLADAA